MKRIFFALVLLSLLTGCGSASDASVTPTQEPDSPVDIAATMMQVQVAAEATKMDVGIRMTATAQQMGVTSTAYAVATQAAVTQQYRQDMIATQQRLDAEATQQQARLDLQATQEQQRLDMQATQQAEATATSFWVTQTALPPAMTLTMIANQQDIALRDNQIELSNLEVQQQREKNTPEWVIPMVVGVILAAVLGLYVVRYSRVREVKNGDGDTEVLILDGDKILRPRLMPGPIVELKPEEITMPLLTSPQEQARVTERAQAVDAIKAMPPSTSPNAAGAFNKYFGPGQDQPFDVIDAEDAPPAGLLDGETVKSLEKDWKEAKDGK